MQNSFFIQQSGVSGWKQIGTGYGYNAEGVTGSFFLAESGDNLGLNTNRPQSTFHMVQESGDGAVLTLQSTGVNQSHLTRTFNAYIAFDDVLGNVGQMGFNKSGYNYLQIQNTASQSGYIILSANPNSDEDVSINSLGNMGLNKIDGDAKFHVVQSGSEPSDNIAIFQKTGSDSYPELIIKRDGKIGVNTYSPKHTVHVLGDKETSGLGTVFSESYLYGYDADYLINQDMGTTSAPAINIDFNGKSFRNINLYGTERHNFATIGGTQESEEMKSVSVKLFASGGPANFEFDSNISFLGSVPTGLASGNIGIISFNSFGPSMSDTVAVFRQPNDALVGPQGAPGWAQDGEPGEGFRNKIIGGDFSTNPWQRLLPNQTGFYDVSSGQYTADRFVYLQTGVADFNVLRDSDSPQFESFYFNRGGLSYPSTGCMTIVCTNTDSGMHTGDTFDPSRGEYLEKFHMIEHRVEGFHIRDLISTDFNLSFWTYLENVSGILPISLRNEKNTISYVVPYDLCETGIWKKIDINIPAVTGAGILKSSFNIDNGVGLRIGWTLGATSGLNVPTGSATVSTTNIYGQEVFGTSGQWISGYYVGWSGNVSGISMPEVNNSLLKIAAPELKRGWRMGDERSLLRSRQQELELCKRYYERFDYVSGETIALSQCVANNRGAGAKIEFQEKRSTPTISGSGHLTFTDATMLNQLLDGTGYANSSTTQAVISGKTNTANLSAGNVTMLQPSGEYFLFVNAEL